LAYVIDKNALSNISYQSIVSKDIYPSIIRCETARIGLGFHSMKSEFSGRMRIGNIYRLQSTNTSVSVPLAPTTNDIGDSTIDNYIFPNDWAKRTDGGSILGGAHINDA